MNRHDTEPAGVPIMSAAMDLRAHVREVPDFPKPGILFRDLTPLMAHPAAFQETVDRLAGHVDRLSARTIVGIESRGFIFGAAVAARLGAGFVPMRKPGKLPGPTRLRRYDLEYGTDGVELHEDALGHGPRVVLIDDVLATGGTANAAIHLLRELGADVAAALFVLELTALNGRKRMEGVPTEVLISYA